MKTYIALVAFAFFAIPISFAQVDIALTDDGSTLTVTYVFVGDYSTPPRNVWNTQVVALRWQADGSGNNPVTFSNFNEPSQFDYAMDGPPQPDDPTPGAATYFFQKFTGNIFFKSIPNASGNTQVVFTLDYVSADGPPMFQLVDTADMPNTPSFLNWETTVTAAAINPPNQFRNFINPNTFPVEWLGFDARPINAADVQLDWATALEVNNSHFSVERSVDGALFETVGRVQGRGTTNEVQEYSYLDKGVNSSLLYYRLKQVDINGAFEYSEVVEVDFSKFPQLKNLDFSIYPSPTTDMVNIELKGKMEDNFVLRITDLAGRLVYEGATAAQVGKNPVDVRKFSEGVYYVSLADIKNNQYYSLGKFVKK
ncbi:MAG: T9SS C-terminal target domain-containing protein [Bacteroidetes bacterium]|nr:MAG: T9SS C-terminal target domain-containing protein [Bacteroidota bacterium]